MPGAPRGGLHENSRFLQPHHSGIVRIDFRSPTRLESQRGLSLRRSLHESVALFACGTSPSQPARNISTGDSWASSQTCHSPLPMCAMMASPHRFARARERVLDWHLLRAPSPLGQRWPGRYLRPEKSCWGVQVTWDGCWQISESGGSRGFLAQQHVLQFRRSQKTLDDQGRSLKFGGLLATFVYRPAAQGNACPTGLFGSPRWGGTEVGFCMNWDLGRR